MFKIDEVRRIDLEEAVRKASLCVADKRTNIPILSHICLTAENGGLVLQGTDLDHEIIVLMPGVAATGKACLPAHALLALLRSFSSETVGIKEIEKGRVEIAAPDAACIFFVPSVEDYPTLNVGERLHQIDLPEGALRFLIDGVLHAMSSEETRYYLRGICFEVEDGTLLRATATNGHILSTVTQLLASHCGMNKKAILPAVSAMNILKIVGSRQATLRFCGEGVTHAVVEAENVIIRTKLIDGPYPDWRRVAPATFDNVATVRTDVFIKSLQPIKAFCRREYRAAHVEFKSDSIKVTVKTPEDGETWALSAASFNGVPFRIGFNPRYLDVLARAISRSGSNEIRISMNDQGSPAMMTRGDGDAFGKHIIMPMRI